MAKWDHGCDHDPLAEAEKGIAIASSILGVLPIPLATVGKMVANVAAFSKAMSVIKKIMKAAKAGVSVANTITGALAFQERCGRSNTAMGFGLKAKSETGGTIFGVKFNVKSEDELMFNHAKTTRTDMVETNDDTSQASFSLQDPDAGDYFVVSVWCAPRPPRRRPPLCMRRPQQRRASLVMHSASRTCADQHVRAWDNARGVSCFF